MSCHDVDTGIDRPIWKCIESLNILKWSRWSAQIGEDASFTNNNKGDWIDYKIGDIVQYDYDGQTRFYRCIQDHFDQEPTIDGNSYWQLLTWTSPEGRLQYCPPDDARLVEGSLYHQLCIGLRGNGLTDSDNDELPDDWERRHGLDPESDAGDDGADGNPDKDRRSNLEEYQANSDPNQTESSTELSIAADGSTIALTASPRGGRSWRIETSDTLSHWTPEPTWLASDGETIIEDSVGSTPMFYRLAYELESQLDLLP